MKYNTYVGYEFEIEGYISSLIDKTRSLTNYEHDFPLEYHASLKNTEKGKWRIEKDASLRYGAEFISPPQKLEKSLITMKTFLDLVKKNGSTTSDRCGCHINMSLVSYGKILRINENALLSNIDWRFLYSLWGNRLCGNHYCKDMSTIFNLYKSRGNCIGMLNIKDLILNEKHNFITRKNSLVSKKGIYYEFRFPGGAGYHLHPDKIEKTVRYLSDLLMKCRRTVNKSKYNKKIISYINRVYKKYDKSKLIDIKFLSNIKPDSVTNNKVFETISYIKYAKRDEAKLRRVISKDMIYYFMKYMYFNIDDALDVSCRPQYIVKSLQKFRRLKSFNIPKNENDVDKLWLASIYKDLLPTEKQMVVKSIKNKKVLRIFNRMLTDSGYMYKISKMLIKNHKQKNMENIIRNG